MWNDTDTPLAYLITFRCYGTWLHGDERGSVNRFHNHYQSPFIEPDKNRHGYNVEKMKSEAIILNVAQRKSVEEAIREPCEVREWVLRALGVRTNHIHIVVSTGDITPQRALNDFKSYSTRKMRQNNCWSSERSPGRIKEAKDFYGMNPVSN